MHIETEAWSSHKWDKHPTCVLSEEQEIASYRSVCIKCTSENLLVRYVENNNSDTESVMVLHAFVRFIRQRMEEEIDLYHMLFLIM